MANREELEIPGIGHPQPFPHAVKIGNMIFTSGIDPIDQSTAKVGTTIEEQARLVFGNLGSILEQAGATAANVGQVTMYMQDPAERAAVNAEWVKMFPDEPRPVRKTIQFDFGSSPIRLQLQVIAVL